MPEKTEDSRTAAINTVSENRRNRAQSVSAATLSPPALNAAARSNDGSFVPCHADRTNFSRELSSPGISQSRANTALQSLRLNAWDSLYPTGSALNNGRDGAGIQYGNEGENQKNADVRRKYSAATEVASPGGENGLPGENNYGGAAPEEAGNNVLDKQGINNQNNNQNAQVFQLMTQMMQTMMQMMQSMLQMMQGFINNNTNNNNNIPPVTNNNNAPPVTNNNRSGYEAIADRIGKSIDRNGREAPLTDTERQNLSRAISSYSPEVLQKMLNSGVRIKLVDEKNAPAGGYPDGSGNWGSQNVQGYYLPGKKTVVLKKSQFGENAGQKDILDGIGTTRHELGHVVDDLLHPDGARPYSHSDFDPQIQRMYNNYRSRVSQNPSLRWDEYDWRSFNRNEYLAEGFQAYNFSQESRRNLQQKDPELYQYIARILGG